MHLTPSERKKGTISASEIYETQIDSNEFTVVFAGGD